MRAAAIGQCLATLLVCQPHAGHALDLPHVGGARFSVPSVSLKQIRFQSTLRQQTDFSCGSAALATLLTHHYHDPVSEQQVFEHMLVAGDQQQIRQHGFSLRDIQRFLHARGYQADAFELPLQQLVEAQLPALVLVSDKGYHHFVVIKGMADGRILLGDPSSGTRSVTRAAFEQIWTNKLLFVIHGHRGPVIFNGLADWRAAPRAPLADAIDRQHLGARTLPKHGPGDF